MATPPNPWPDEFAYQYAEVLALARKICRLGQASVEQGIGGSHNIHFLKRWLRLMRLHAVEIGMHVQAIANRRATTARMPNWVVFALENIPALVEEVVAETRSAGRLVMQANPNLEAAELAIDRAWAAGLLIEKYLLAGPPPAGDAGDVLEQVKEIVKTLEE